MLIEKLKVKPGNVAVIGAPPAILSQFKSVKPATSIPARKTALFDFILLFATRATAMVESWRRIVPALKDDAVFWVAYPKKSSGIESDLSGMTGWSVYKGSPWQPVSSVSIDETWTGVRFRYAPGLEHQREARPAEDVRDSDGSVVIDRVQRLIHPPKDLAALFGKHPEVRALFDRLAFTNRKEYVQWIVDAKKAETRAGRLQSTLEKLVLGKKNPAQK